MRKVLGFIPLIALAVGSSAGLAVGVIFAVYMVLAGLLTFVFSGPVEATPIILNVMEAPHVAFVTLVVMWFIVTVVLLASWCKVAVAQFEQQRRA